MILLGWCYSLNSDVSLLLRSQGIFSEMMLSHDLKLVIGRPSATLNPQQKDLISNIGKVNFITPQLNENICSEGQS